MKPIKTKIAILLLGVLLVGVSGCKKCYTCRALRAGFVCYNGSDSLGIQTTHGNQVIDSLKYYHDKGYTCDTAYFFYVENSYYNNPVCSQMGYDEAMNYGDKCEPIK